MPRKTSSPSSVIMSEHTQSDIWNRLQVQNESIVEIARSQATTDTRLSGLESKFDEGFRNINSQLQSMANRMFEPPKAPNYVAWIGGMVAVLAMFGGYSALMTQPLQQQIEVNREANADVHELQQRIAYLEGKGEAYEKWVEDIDKYGSRRWAGKQPIVGN